MGRVGTERLAGFGTLTTPEVIDGAEVGVALGTVKEKRAHPQTEIAHEPSGVPGFMGTRAGHRLKKMADGVLRSGPPQVASIICKPWV